MKILIADFNYTYLGWFLYQIFFSIRILKNMRKQHEYR
jgi:hypothetical protein